MSDVKKYRKQGKTKFDKPNSMKGKLGRKAHKQCGGVREKSSLDVFVEPPPKPGTCTFAIQPDIEGPEIARFQQSHQDMIDINTFDQDRMLSHQQEKVLRGATKHLLTSAKRTSDPDVIFVRNERGPPIKLQKVTDTRVDSKGASKRTVRNRAKSHEQFERRTSCVSATRASEETIYIGKPVDATSSADEA